MYLPGHRIRVRVGDPVAFNADAGVPLATLLANAVTAVGTDDKIISVKGLSIQDEAAALNVPNSEGRRGYDGAADWISDRDPTQSIAMFNHVIHGLKDGKVTLHGPTIADVEVADDGEMLWPNLPGQAATTDSRRFRRGGYVSLKVHPNKNNVLYYWLFTCMAVISTKYDPEVDGLQPYSVDLTADGQILIVTNGTYAIL